MVTHHDIWMKLLVDHAFGHFKGRISERLELCQILWTSDMWDRCWYLYAFWHFEDLHNCKISGYMICLLHLMFGSPTIVLALTRACPQCQFRIQKNMGKAKTRQAPWFTQDESNRSWRSNISFRDDMPMHGLFKRLSWTKSQSTNGWKPGLVAISWYFMIFWGFSPISSQGRQIAGWCYIVPK
jgi:hypothetical protein